MEVERVICTNRKAIHDYHIEDSYEAGLVLVGSEVKSLRAGRANLKDSYAGIKEGEVYLYNCHISPYAEANQFNHEPRRTRKLLLHKGEIKKLVGKTTERGYTLVPLKLYFKGGKAKVQLALARGKKLYDKRRAIKEREDKRELARALKERSFTKG
jgi:SsrA-binding protein